MNPIYKLIIALLIFVLLYWVLGHIAPPGVALVFAVLIAAAYFIYG
jgi:hypothetical protein